MALEQIAEEYFSQLNPMARRMYADMKETKSAYEDLWESISEKEQKQLLSESIITPEVLLKYKQNEIEESVSEYAVKLIIDDHCTYQDEHSGPFSFKTRSQRNLTLFEAEEKPKPVVKHKPKKKVVEMFEVPEDKIEKDSVGNTLPKTGLDFLDNW
ncbi:uncharacterized protein C1orf198 homolog [Tribolium castaneum]|uniref:Uncharacterized protein C1orf198 homolog-like Protein n=1 Tax=Tribolium castaneum TaxID=7070 RepID=D6WMJ4_TRICA|nr:PREDICTED: uncharacterized protein C1orf198 homolog [Tribolium castaneum]EFA03289.1 Uncharacterized protein C1orf198 homolog-like Protein [Tribolium castaneum]|eukprot:XP_008194014.1 PREDICTED: uncharacterized protein C1orf198 homolog [Tribolium castaneum]